MLSNRGVLDRVLAPRTDLLGVIAATVGFAAACHPQLATYFALPAISAASVTVAWVLADLATRPVSLRRGDDVELDSGLRGRVRAVRWCYTVIEVVNGDTLLVPTSVIFAGRLKRV